MTDDLPDRPDLTPPTPEPLSDERRGAIRAQLLAASEERHAPSSHRWLMPGLAAAAVLAIVGAGAYAAANSGGAGNSLQPLVPAGAGTSTTASTMPETSQPHQGLAPSPPARPPKTRRSHQTVTALPPPTHAPAGLRVSCDDEVARSGRPSLRGATVTAQQDSGRGTTYLYESKTAWVICDDTTAVPGGPESEQGYLPTLTSFHLRSEGYEPGVDTLAISENLIGFPDDYNAIQFGYFFAAGRDFDGVQAIFYSFPDGHTEQATIGQDGLWSMAYVVTGGVLVDPKNNELDLDPITATVAYSNGDEQTFTLQWGLDTCAQINHGC